MDNLHHQLPRLNAFDNIATESFRLHIIGKLLRDRVAHISVNQGSANLLHRLGNVNIGNATLAAQRV